MLGDLADGVAAGRPRDVARDLRPSGGGEAAIHGARVYGDFAANLDLCGGCRCSAGLGSVVERNPTSARFQFAPLGGSSAIGLGNDSVDTGLDEALAAVIRAGARADVQVAGCNLDGVVGGSSAGRFAGRVAASVAGGAAQATIHRLSDSAMSIVEIVSGASLCRIIPVYGHVAAVKMIHAGRFVRRPDQLLDVVSLADVSNQIDESVVRLCAYRPVGSASVVCHFNGYGSLVVGIGRGAPRAIAFIHIKSDAAIAAYAIVA